MGSGQDAVVGGVAQHARNAVAAGNRQRGRGVGDVGHFVQVGHRKTRASGQTIAYQHTKAQLLRAQDGGHLPWPGPDDMQQGSLFSQDASGP